MANYSTLKAAVADVVKTNGTQAITGANLQAVLLSIINSVGGGGYIFKDVATPSTDAGTPDENVFYLGGAGTYANFGTSVTVPVGSIGVFKYNGSWTTEQIALFAGIDDVPTTGSDNLVKSGGIDSAIEGLRYGNSFPYSIRNGSQGNGGNSWVISLVGENAGSTVSVIPVTAGKKYRVIINKQPQSGYDYYMRIITYSTTTPTNYVSNTIRNECNDWNIYYKSGEAFQINNAEVAVSVQITELAYAGASQAAGSCIALRASDFSDGDILFCEANDDSLYSVENKIEKEIAEPVWKVQGGTYSTPFRDIAEFGGYFSWWNGNFTVSSTMNYCVIEVKEQTQINIHTDSSTAAILSANGYNENLYPITAGQGSTALVKKFLPAQDTQGSLIINRADIPATCKYIALSFRGDYGAAYTIIETRDGYDAIINDIENEIIGLNGDINDLGTEISAAESDIVAYSKMMYGIPSAQSPYYIDYNTSTRTLTIPADTLGLFHNIDGTKVYVSFPATTITFDNSDSSAVKIVWDKNSSTFVKKGYSYLLSDSELFICGVRRGDEQTSKIATIFPWSINGKPYGIDVPDIYNSVDIYNGSVPNGGNTNFVRTAVLPTNGATKFVIHPTRPNTNGCHYAFAWSLTSSTNEIGRVRNYYNWEGKIAYNDITSNMTEDYIVDLTPFPTAVGVAFTIGEFNAAGVEQALRNTDFAAYPTYAIGNIGTELLVKAVNNEVVERNKSRNIPLQAMCRYRTGTSASPKKDYMALICTDSHNDYIAVYDAVSATNGFSVIDNFIHCGDIAGSYPTDASVSSFQTSFARLTKAGYVCLGNHDVGNAYYVGFCYNNTQAYNAWIKPMVDAGYLSTGEYEANKCYWYHDNATYKIRTICLNEFDDPMDLADSSYWESVTFDSSATTIRANTSYSVGDIVKCGSYIDYCFRCKSPVTTPSSFYYELDKLPHFKIHRGTRVIRQTQAQWFLDILASTPANYGVIIITHQIFSPSAVSIESKFSQSVGIYGSGMGLQNNMETDFIASALQAFVAGSSLSLNVAMKGDAAYLNTQGGGTYAYSVSKNFASKNTGVYLMGVLSGHIHRDYVAKLGNIYSILPICATTDIDNNAGNDIRRSNQNELTHDCATAVSFAQNRIGLVKIGVNVTDTGKMRDFEVINISE